MVIKGRQHSRWASLTLCGLLATGGCLSAEISGIGAGAPCGDGVCTDGESCAACPEDCGICSSETCGDGWCQDGEVDCLLDCGPGPEVVCGDEICAATEDCHSCALDCGICSAVETLCDNGVDDDQDGSTDCADDDCLGEPFCFSGPDGPWTSCTDHSFGTMLICTEDKCPEGTLRPIDVLTHANELGVKGLAGTGAPSPFVKDEMFSVLPGWTRAFMRGTYETLVNIHETATRFGMEEMYECFCYGPETEHNAGDEALDPDYWVPRAKALAEAAGKCLIYGPAVRDYERMATSEGETEIDEAVLGQLIGSIAPEVDIWMVQLGKHQPWVDKGYDDDGNPFTMADFQQWMGQWVSWIKGGNPSTQVWVQLGIGEVDPIAKVCLPPQPPEYILEFRETLIAAGVDGVWVMPAQPCMPCPDSPAPGFICSVDAQDHEYYRQSLLSFQQAIDMACNPSESTE